MCDKKELSKSVRERRYRRERERGRGVGECVTELGRSKNVRERSGKSEVQMSVWQ